MKGRKGTLTWTQIAAAALMVLVVIAVAYLLGTSIKTGKKSIEGCVNNGGTCVAEGEACPEDYHQTDALQCFGKRTCCMPSLLTRGRGQAGKNQTAPLQPTPVSEQEKKIADAEALVDARRIDDAANVLESVRDDDTASREIRVKAAFKLAMLPFRIIEKDVIYIDEPTKIVDTVQVFCENFETVKSRYDDVVDEEPLISAEPIPFAWQLSCILGRFRSQPPLLPVEIELRNAFAEKNYCGMSLTTDISSECEAAFPGWFISEDHTAWFERYREEKETNLPGMDYTMQCYYGLALLRTYSDQFYRLVELRYDKVIPCDMLTMIEERGPDLPEKYCKELLALVQSSFPIDMEECTPNA
ncbi:hypothetical protein HYS47_03515 [Candidatus Woesearchaeota archaeon]|nr:hypothetical protein [Candidatus Woesearchaeota archaeon]